MTDCSDLPSTLNGQQSSRLYQAHQLSSFISTLTTMFPLSMRMCKMGKSQFSTGVVTTLSKEDLRELCATVQSRENSTYFHTLHDVITKGLLQGGIVRYPYFNVPD